MSYYTIHAHMHEKCNNVKKPNHFILYEMIYAVSVFTLVCFMLNSKHILLCFVYYLYI